MPGFRQRIMEQPVIVSADATWCGRLSECLGDMTRSRFPICALAVFALLSVADFALTRQLLAGAGGAYEANPTARWVLQQHGWSGLAIFKLGAGLLAASVTALVYYFRPRAGARLMAFGCAVLALVVGYSGVLLAAHHTGLGGPDIEMAREQREAARLKQEKVQCDHYAVVVRQISDQLTHGKLTLERAVERVAETEQAQDPKWLRPLHTNYPGLTDRGCLAASIVQFALEVIDLPAPAGERAARRLLAELYALCGTDSADTFYRIQFSFDSRWPASSGPVQLPVRVPRPFR
jgi:hypothetical protein